ncbi:MAG TPA: phosphatase PAP2 family protein [Thermoanaerobaculia bacterium]
MNRASEDAAFRWSMVADSFRRPYPVPLPMVVLLLLVPVYLFIPSLTPVRTLHVPELALDRAVPLQPVWALIYGAVYVFLILLPLFVVRQEPQIRRTLHAYLLVWLTAYVCFILYPTVASRPESVTGEGFAVWGLNALYSSDPPYNCFPSIHVAHSFVSAMTCRRVHRGLGNVTLACAALVGVSTLFTKQHYVADVLAGILLALVADALFLRRFHPHDVPELDRRLAPALALVTLGLVSAGVAGFWALYQWQT